ncbi:MAG: ABC transporter permease [Theionarchaea archaeon]|nr:ABC transporter permease [Theionarchaea archaeon]
MKKINLGAFVIKKILGSLITIFLVMSVLFVLLHSVAGGDMVTRLAPFAGAEVKEQLRELWGLNDPLYEQYLIFMKKVFTLDYRLTYDETETSLDLLLFYMPYTILLFGTATIITYLTGFFMGIRLLVRKNSKIRHLVTGIAVVFYAVPAFVLVVYLKNWFMFKYEIFPPITAIFQGPDAFPDGVTLMDHLANIKIILPSMSLPLLVLIIIGLARPLLLLKDHMVTMLGEPFVLTARAKGLKESQVISKHVARCALLPLLSDASINLPLIISGGIIIEYICNWPGIGTQLFYALKVLYYPTISAAIFLLTVILVSSMIIVDTVNAYLDPRVNV